MPDDTRATHPAAPNSFQPSEPGFHVARHTAYMADQVGTVALSPQGAFECGSYQTFRLVFTAGRFGVDDTGGLRVVFRFPSDMGTPQFTDPGKPNHVSAEASNGAVLRLTWDPRLNMRPWGKTITVTVVKGCMAPNETISITFGGTPGFRMQTFREDRFEFRVLADVFSTGNFALLPDQPFIELIPGPPETFRAMLPTLRRANETFTLALRADDRWGNPSHLVAGEFRLVPSAPIAGLPESFTWTPGAKAMRFAGLSAAPGDLSVALLSAGGEHLVTSNPLRLVERAALLPYWADLHGQSAETIGTNSVEAYAAYARDLACVDVICHQGNDFQITQEFWRHLNQVAAEFDRPGEFVFFPGYEWSGNTMLGGDRNVIYLEQDQTLHRSCHALVDDMSDAATDAFDAHELHAKLAGRKCLLLPHVGGRYANLHYAHDRNLERSVEVHSDWGTFDWLLHDAFAVGARVGIAANSDGHKGRHGASHPGAGMFGSYGGLTCYLAERLDRAAIFEAMRARRQYATTGCRVHLDAHATFDAPCELFLDDPAIQGATPTGRADRAGMGEILRGPARTARFQAELLAASPIERVAVFNRLEQVALLRPFAAKDLGQRIRVVWEGSEYRGRGRETTWHGSARLTGNAFTLVAPINRWNLDRRFDHDAASVAWESITTGGFAGFEAVLENPTNGRLAVETPHGKLDLDVAAIGMDDTVLEAGGLGRRLRVFRLPDVNPHTRMHIDLPVALTAAHDNALYLRAVLEDGNVVWSSPIYLIPA